MDKVISTLMSFSRQLCAHDVVSERFHFELFHKGPDLLTYLKENSVNLVSGQKLHAMRISTVDIVFILAAVKTLGNEPMCT